MAELCKQCFLKVLYPYCEEIRTIEEDIVMSEHNEVCECCGQYIPYVHHLGKDMSCAEHDALAARIADEFIKYGHT